MSALLALYCQSILSFLTLTLLIQLLFFLFRPKSARLRYLLRLLPMVKLPIDFAMGCSEQWVGWIGIDPALLPTGTRWISMTGQLSPLPTLRLGCHTDGGYRFGWTDWGSSQIAQGWITLAASLCLLFSLARVALFLWRSSTLHRELHGIVERGRRIGPLLLSDEVDAPFSCGAIFLPKRGIYSPAERRAIIAHEAAHLRWCDGAVALLLELITAFFWPLPFVRRWLKKIDLERERSCDAAAPCQEALLAALLKTAQLKRPLGLSFRGPLYRRVDWLTRKKRRGWAQWILPLLALGLLFSDLWSL